MPFHSKLLLMKMLKDHSLSTRFLEEDSGGSVKEISKLFHKIVRGR